MLLAMRIVHAINTLSPAEGGPPVVAASLAAAQAVSGHDVTIVAYAHPAAAGPDDPEPLTADAPGFDAVRLVRPPMPDHREKLLATHFRAAMTEALRDADALHIHRVWETCVPAAATAARKRGVPYVISPHGMLHPWSLRQSRWKKRVAFALGYRRAIAGAAVLHALNAEERAAVDSLHFGPDVRVVPNGIWPGVVDRLPPLGRFRAAHPELGDRPFVLFLARLHHKKGPDVMVDALQRVAARDADLRVVMAGEDFGSLEPTRQRAQAAGVADRLLLPGALYGEQKWAALRDASIFCLPSRQEGLPMGVLEAMAAGVPPVITPQCNMPEVAEREAGLVVPLDADAVAEAWLRLLREPDLRERQAAAGRQLVADRFTWPSVAQQMVKVYEHAHAGN